MKYLQLITEFNEISIVVRILLAMILGGIIGMEREKNKRPAGFRTHILVCVGSCMTAMIGLYAWKEMGVPSDPLRISAQVISGIGFLGVGTILVKEHDHITGLTTAAGLWATATIGISCGFGFYMGALLGTLVVAITSAVLYKLESRSRKKNRKIILYVELKGVEHLNKYIDLFTKQLEARSVLVVAPRTAVSGNVGLEITLPLIGNEDTGKVLEVIRAEEQVVFAMEVLKGEKRN